MKYIIKSGEPEEFTKWKDKANADWQPSFDNLQNPEKNILKQSLLKEQGYICCYCECEISQDHQESHIEHFIPQSICHSRALDYDNLLCSCGPKEKKKNKDGQNESVTRNHCGDFKEDWFDGVLLISPLDMKCKDRFVFEKNGKIQAASEDDKAAIKTIQILGLDKLDALREGAFKRVNGDDDQEKLTDDEFLDFMEGYRHKGNNEGKYSPYWTYIRFMYSITD